jgi:hypothetical protein
MTVPLKVYLIEGSLVESSEPFILDYHSNITAFTIYPGDQRKFGKCRFIKKFFARPQQTIVIIIPAKGGISFAQFGAGLFVAGIDSVKII